MFSKPDEYKNINTTQMQKKSDSDSESKSIKKVGKNNLNSSNKTK